MNGTPFSSSATYPLGFLDFLTLKPLRGHRVGDYEMTEAGMARFNQALRALSQDVPTLTLDQFATAAQRSLDRYKDGRQPAFVSSRLAVLERMEQLAADPGWEVDADFSRGLAAVRDYVAATDDLIPDGLPVVGRLDDAVLIDVAQQLVREDLADYEDFCRFRQVAAEFAGVGIQETGLSRAQWLEALLQAHGSNGFKRYGRHRPRYVPDPRASLFHIT